MPIYLVASLLSFFRKALLNSSTPTEKKIVNIYDQVDTGQSIQQWIK